MTPRAERTLVNNKSSVATSIEATELEYLQHTNEVVAKAIAIRESYANFLAVKYKLEDNDSISSTTGHIVRASMIPTQEDLRRSYSKAVASEQLAKTYKQAMKDELDSALPLEQLPL